MGEPDREQTEPLSHRHFFDQATMGMLYVRNRKIVQANQQLGHIFRCEPEQLLGRSTACLFPDEQAYKDVGIFQYARIFADGHTAFERTMRRLDGSIFWCRLEGRPVDLKRPDAGLIWYVDDRNAERGREERALLHTGLFEKSAQAIIVTDPDGRIMAVNQAFTRITGYNELEVFGRNPSILQSGRHGRDFYQNMWASLQTTGQWQGEVWNRRKNGEIYPELLQIIAIQNEEDEISNYVGFFTDLSGMKQNEAQMEQLARMDSLTGLPRRAALLDRLRAYLEDLQDDDRLAVLAIDIDLLKRINESQGLEVGDALLLEFANRLKNFFQENDFIARLEGDDFIVITRMMDHASLALQIGQVVQQLSAPYPLKAHTFHIQTSIGVAIAPDDSRNAETLIQYANLAQNREKDFRKGNFEFFRHGMTEESENQLRLEHELRLALVDDQFVVYYQPQCRLEDNRVVGMEALVRWQHPERGLLPPAEFISAAESFGLISQLNAKVMRLACHAARGLLDQNLTFGRISINSTPTDFQRPDYAEYMQEILTSTDLSPQLLTIEITETMAMQNTQHSARVLHQLRELGIRIAMDDFGTGYSSINGLRTLPIDYIKLDRSYVKDISHSPQAYALTRAIVSMAMALELEVVAEGVEEEIQRTMLMEMGCQVYQGFLYARPMAIDELSKQLIKIA